MGTSVYVSPGNHDILNPWALGFNDDQRYLVDSINDKEFSAIYNNFGYNEAILKDENSLSYLAAPSEEIWLLMLDTNMYLNNQKYGYPQTEGMIKEETMEWIQECNVLAKENNSDKIINSEGFILWKETPPSFIKSYIMSIYSDEDIDDNKFNLKGSKGSTVIKVR